MNFVLHPWHKYDPSIRDILGLPRSAIMLKDLDKKNLQINDEVVFLNFHSSNQMVVWMAKDVEHEEKLAEEIEIEGPKVNVAFWLLHREMQMIYLEFC